MKQEPKHWYLLSFMVQQPGLWVPMSALMASDEINLTIPQINAAKQVNQIPPGSVLMSVSYFGFGTEKKVNGLPDIDPPTIASEPYMQGTIAAIRISSHDSRQPINPYVKPEMDAYAVAEAEEWRRGFDATRQAQSADSSKVIQAPMPEEPKAPTVSGETKPSSTRSPAK